MNLFSINYTEKDIRDYIVPEIKLFFNEDRPFDSDRRSQLSSLVKEIVRDGHGELLHESMLSFIERYFYARDGVLKWDFRLKRFLLDDIIEEDVLFGRWASGQDILLAADEWSNSLLDSSSNPCYFLWMIECMVKTGYETDWEDLRQKTCNKLLKEEVYGNYQRSEMYAMLYGASTIYSHPGLSDEKKIELLVLLKWHWNFLKNIYSIMFRCIVGHRLTNMAQVANTVTLSKANQPFLHLYYGALKGNIDHFCVKKGDRKKLENLLLKIEGMVKSGVPSDQLDELYDILFPEEFQDYVEKNRPKNYNQLEAEYESFKREMNERMRQMNKLVSEMVGQMKNLVADDKPSDAIADTLKQIAPGIALDMFCQLNEQLDKNDNWKTQAEKIATSVIQRMDEKILTINVVHLYGKGANHWDHHKNLTINLDLENKDKKKNKLE